MHALDMSVLRALRLTVAVGPGQHGPRNYRHTGAFLAAMLAALLATTGYVVLHIGDDIRREASRNAFCIARALESTSSTLLSQPVASLLSVEKELAGLSRDPETARRALAHALPYDPTSVYLGVAAPDGSLMVLPREGVASSEVVDALRGHLAPPQTGLFGVQQLLTLPGRTEWFMPITLAAREGGGYSFALVSARQLVAGTDTLELLSQSYVSFIAADGRRLLRYWKDTDTFEINGLPLPGDRLDEMKEQGSGSIDFMHGATGQPMIAGYIHSTVLPMYVAAVAPTQGWQRRWMKAAVGPLILFAAGMATIAAYAFRLRRALLAEAAVREQALTDKLTELPNRRALEAELAHELSNAARCGEGFAVIALDIDHFKAINDTFGHHAGDEVLCDVAHRLLASMRGKDRVFRQGGEEFCVLVPGGDAREAGVLAERLRRAVAQPASPKMHAVTASFGVAAWQPGDDADTLLERADEALYRAKAGGRNRIETS